MHHEALSIRKELYDNEDKTNEKMTRSLRALGRVHCALDKPREGVGYLEKALKGVRSLYGPGVVRLEIAYSMDELGQAYAIIGMYCYSVTTHRYHGNTGVTNILNQQTCACKVFC